MQYNEESSLYPNITPYELTFLNRGYHDKGIENKIFFPLDEDGKKIDYGELEFYEQNPVTRCFINDVSLVKCRFMKMSFENCVFVKVNFVECLFVSVTFRNCIFRDCNFLDTRIDSSYPVWKDCYFANLRASRKGFFDKNVRGKPFRSETFSPENLIWYASDIGLHEKKMALLESEAEIISEVVQKNTNGWPAVKNFLEMNLNF